MNIRFSVLLPVALAVALTLRSVLSTWGCVTASPPGTYVSIGSEKALIVWDPATHMEQFIRRASFFGQVPQFGFLVPTPPKLSKTDSSISDTLAWTYHPRLVSRPEHGLKLISLFERHYALRSAGTEVPAKAEVQHVSVINSEQVVR